jgi:hypothetical protein
VSIKLFILGDLGIFVSLVEYKGILQLDSTRDHKVSTVLSDASVSNKSIDLYMYYITILVDKLRLLTLEEGPI